MTRHQLLPSPHQLEPDDSQAVLEHFGPEAPGLLNAYACKLEDLLLEQQHRLVATQVQPQALQRECDALRRPRHSTTNHSQRSKGLPQLPLGQLRQPLF